MYEDDDDIIDNDDIQQQQQQQLDPGSQQQQQQTPQPVQIDHNALAASVAAAIQQTQQPQQRQLTPEELAQHFQIWNPDERFVSELNKLYDQEASLEEKQKVLHGLRDGIMQQAFRAAQLYVEEQLGQFRQQMAPALEYAQAQQATKLMKEFHGKYPALKGHEELVDSITARLSAQGFRPKSKDEAFDKVAEIAESFLKKANPQFVLKKSGGNQGMPSMAGTNMGGFGGSGVPKQSADSGKRGGLAKIFQ